jgi:beta-lactamase regulating signal transducer with metallopeptidase domain
MPWGIESRMSPFNYLPAPLENETYMPFLTEHDLSIPLIQDDFDSANPASNPSSNDSDPAREPARGYLDSYSGKEAESFHYSLSLENALLILWFTGVMLFGIIVLFKNIAFWLRVRRLPLVDDYALLDILDKCRLSLGIRRDISVIVTDNVKSPALFGYFRPRLLLPPHFFTTLYRHELRYVLLHELSHLKRHDIVVSWLATVFQIIYWFNPFVWYAFHHLRVDQEAACDAYVLSRMKQIQPADYANTIVSLLESFVRNRQLPSLVGIIEDRSQIRKRITRILNFKRYSLQAKSTSILMLLTVGLVLLTGSKGKADTNRTEVADEIKAEQIIKPIKEDSKINLAKAASEYVNTQEEPLGLSDNSEQELASENTNDDQEEDGIVASDKTVKNIGMKEAVDIKPAKKTTKTIDTSGGPLVSTENYKERTTSGIFIPIKETTISGVYFSEVEETEHEQDVEASRVLQKRQDSPFDNSSGDIFDSKTPGALPAKYNLDGELESVDQINTIGEKKWQEVDDQSIILRVSWRYYYLLVLRRPIGMKYSNPSVGLSRTSSITVGIDRIFVSPSSSSQGYVIEKIYKLKGRKQAKEIKERLREDIEKRKDSSVDHTSRVLSDSKKLSALPEKYNLDHEFESIDQIFSVKGPRMKQVDDQSVILKVGWRDYYLLVLRRPMDIKYSNPNISLARTAPSVTAGFDRVFVTPSSSEQGYVIEKIFKLKGKEQAEEIKERLRRS